MRLRPSAWRRPRPRGRSTAISRNVIFRRPAEVHMIQSHEPAILDLAVISLHDAIRRVAARILMDPGALEVMHFRRVERLMRLAIALGGAGRGLPFVEFH